MNIHALFRQERAVSPVISVILMIAITTILASVVGVFAVGLGEQAQTDVPEVDFDFTYESSPLTVTISHERGQAIEADNLEIRGAHSGSWSSSRVSSGDEWTGTVSGDEILIIWRDDDGRTSHVIARSPVPS